MILRPALATALAALLATAGCARVGAGAPGTGALHPWTKPDTVRIGLYEEPDTLSPVTSEMSFTSDVIQLVFDGLIRYDERGNPVPDLAKEIPSQQNGDISADGKTITYHLLPATWTDGVPLTSKDVIFTWHAIMNPANNAPTRNGYDRITAMDAPDAHTVRVHFAQPYAPAIYLFRDGAQGAILPEHILGKEPNVNHLPYNSAPIGSGPYVLERWAHGNEMVFHANPNYFRGKAKIEHVVMKFVPNQNTLSAETRAHEVDVFYDVPPLIYEQLKGASGLGVAQSATFHWEHLNFNTRKAPLDDVAVRRALCAALDEKAIFHDFYRDEGVTAPTHFNPSLGWGDPAVNYVPFDPKAAGAALEADGWKLAGDGFRYKDGKRLAFDLSTVAGVKSREAIEVFAQAAWRAIGADVAVHNYLASLLFAPKAEGGLIQNGKTDVALFEWDNVTPDPDDITYVGPRSMPPDGQNDSFYLNPQVGALEAQGIATFDHAKREAIYAQISRILIRDVPEYVFAWKPEIVVFNGDLKGIAPVPVGSDLWNIAAWTY